MTSALLEVRLEAAKDERIPGPIRSLCQFETHEYPPPTITAQWSYVGQQTVLPGHSTNSVKVCPS
jgi:hypothetical protein